MAEPSGKPAGSPHAARMSHMHTTHAGKDPSPAIKSPHLLRAPFHFIKYCRGVVTRARNVSEYMFVLVYD